ncbi:tyrosine kinase [Medicago truncatula]|uniref:Tyrosine kinase n=1 Tax=Medicago truncatula TaxID=3880 RepID=G7KRF8_MEDTR|nr:tyrosine kinase [Medicago truncatula]
MEFSEWRRSMVVSLSSVDYDGYTQSRSISIVPEVLKKSNEDAYTPRAVSIGPRFKGSREDLLLMEEIKIRCMMYLFHREQLYMSVEEKLSACCELLISKGLDDELPCQLKSPAPAPQVLRDEDVLSDLALLENQIPICVLHELSRKLFDNFFKYDVKERATRINNLVLSLLGYSQLQIQSIKASHILDIVHFFVNGKGEMQSKTESCINQEYNFEDIIDTQQQHVVKLKLKCCAFRLLTSGVTIKPLSEKKDKELGLSCFNLAWKSLCGVLFRLINILVNGKHLNLNHIPEEVEVKGLDFYFKFQNGELEIEQLHIIKTTKAKWCNIIAWEDISKMYHIWKTATSLVVMKTKSFSYNSLRSATGDFHPSCKIGGGGYGVVYKGVLRDGTQVAIKSLSVESKQGTHEFMTEIAMISNIQHPNLVKLIGFCIEGNHRILVYEFLKNNSLASSLLEILVESSSFNLHLRNSRRESTTRSGRLKHRSRRISEKVGKKMKFSAKSMKNQ